MIYQCVFTFTKARVHRQDLVNGEVLPNKRCWEDLCLTESERATRLGKDCYTVIEQVLSIEKVPGLIPNIFR